MQRCKLRDYTFSQLVTRWKRSGNDNIETRTFITDLIELGLPGLCIVGFAGTSDIYFQFYDGIDIIFDNLESFCLSLKEDVCWPIHFQKWVLIKFLIHTDNEAAFSTKNKEFYDSETNRNKLICQEFEKYYIKDKYPRFYADILLSAILPETSVDTELLTDKRDLQTLQTCVKYSKLVLQDNYNVDINDNVSLLNKELDKIYFPSSYRINTYVNCVGAYAQGLKKFEKFDKIACLWLEWIKDISTYQQDFDIGINMNVLNRNFNCNQNNCIYSVKLIFQRWRLTKNMIDSILDMIEFILWYDLKTDHEHCTNLQHILHILNKICVAVIKYDKYFDKLKHELMSMSSNQVSDTFFDDIIVHRVKKKYTCCRAINSRQEEIKMIQIVCFKLMMHNFLLHGTGCYNYSFNHSYSSRHKYNCKYNYLKNNVINLEYLNKAKFCLENPLANKLNVIQHDELFAYSIYWILGDEEKCYQIKQMIFRQMQINSYRCKKQFESIDMLKNEYLSIVKNSKRYKNLEVRYCQGIHAKESKKSIIKDSFQ